MSSCHWNIRGVGMNLATAKDRLNCKSVVALLMKKAGDPSEDLLALKKGVDQGAMAYGEFYDKVNELTEYDIASLFLDVDDTGVLCTDSSTEEETDYLYFPPCMPWEVTDRDPKSLEECIRLIVETVQKLTDMSEEEIRSMIDSNLDIFVCD